MGRREKEADGEARAPREFSLEDEGEALDNFLWRRGVVDNFLWRTKERAL